MNFNDYPLKVELSDGLHVYERETGKSAHMLVEQLINEFLIKEGYLNIAIENLVKYPEKLLNIDEEISVDEDCEGIDSSELTSRFSLIQKPNGIREVCFGEFSFGNYPSNETNEIISKLSKFPDNELKEMSLNNWEDTNQSYYKYLESKFENHSISPKDFLKEWFSEKRVFYHESKNSYQVKKHNTNFGSYPSFEEAKHVVYFMVDKDWDEKYSTKYTKLKGKKYREWLFSEIEKEGK